jgi:hypothetical protein
VSSGNLLPKTAFTRLWPIVSESHQNREEKWNVLPFDNIPRDFFIFCVIGTHYNRRKVCVDGKRSAYWQQLLSSRVTYNKFVCKQIIIVYARREIWTEVLMISNGKKFMKCLVDCISLMLFHCDSEKNWKKRNLKWLHRKKVLMTFVSL